MTGTGLRLNYFKHQVTVVQMIGRDPTIRGGRQDCIRWRLEDVKRVRRGKGLRHAVTARQTGPGLRVRWWKWALACGLGPYRGGLCLWHYS